MSGVCLEKVKWRDGRAPGKERGGRRWARVWRNLELEGMGTEIEEDVPSRHSMARLVASRRGRAHRRDYLPG